MLQQAVAQLHWHHSLVLLTKLKDQNVHLLYTSCVLCRNHPGENKFTKVVKIDKIVSHGNPLRQQEMAAAL